MKYKFKVGDKFIYTPTNTPFIVVKVIDDGYFGYTLALANGLPGVPLKGNMRFISDKDVFKSYEPMDPAIRLLYKES